MANILGVNIETPQEAQQRLLQEQLARGRNVSKDPNAQLGFGLGTALNNIFGKGSDEARDRAKLFSDSEDVGQLKAAQEQLGQEYAQRNAQIGQAMQAQGASQEQIQSALASSKQGFEQTKAQLTAKGAEAFVDKTVDHYVANRGMSEISAKQYARAEAALRLDKLPGEENKMIAQQLRDVNTAEMRQDKQIKLEQSKLKAQTEQAEAATALSKRGLLEELSVEELEAERELATQRGEPTSKFDGLIREKQEAEQAARDKLQIQRDDLRLREKKEERIANQLNTTEFGILKTSNQLYDESKTMERSAVETRERLERAVAAGRGAGKALDINESMKNFMGMQDADISTVQNALAERAMKRAFSLKQAGSMSDAEFDAYMTAVPGTNASAEQWNEFLRQDALIGARGAARASFIADFIGGVDMSDAYPGIPSTEGVPRGMEGLNVAWRAYEDKLYNDINAQYSRESWGSMEGVSTATAADPNVDLSDEDWFNKTYGTGGSPAINRGKPINVPN